MPTSSAPADPARALRRAWNSLRPTAEKQRYHHVFEQAVTALQDRATPLSHEQACWLDRQLRRAGTGPHGVFVLAAAPATLLRSATPTPLIN
ncbi:hypothetical protein [Deinococcus soli (ex Cha et al. 2016)]|uniref:Uncharacterized protein n=2 Tax=Deinococcus soli (ex Cha et al. 2016) TaxID=1309411 RepID=A0AAE4BLP1_9DEIO|nr:hypothetical protein [Deinococcus soli (ex Cha et al. 2016)]MDR6218210.1 hypothetical protein [Deinococcus soli (ex Cha et al. 2016)]MDR6328950.1 hypothetical protein [Deinococcus soli (ex Cha et al. 2016)]MDR6751223.1 hypothetical protein [Deinococcus soli (ex Cha et al. 2016)]